MSKIIQREEKIENGWKKGDDNSIFSLLFKATPFSREPWKSVLNEGNVFRLGTKKNLLFGDHICYSFLLHCQRQKGIIRKN